MSDFINLYSVKKVYSRAELWGISHKIIDILEELLIRRKTFQKSLIKEGKSTRAEKLKTDDGALWFLKWYKVKGIFNFIFYRVGMAPPFRAVYNARLIMEKGFPVLVPEGIWLFRSPLSEGFWGGLIFSYVEDFEKLPFLWEKARRDPKFLGVILSDLTMLLERLHARGIYIRDTKANNFLLRPGKEPLLFDLDTVKIFQGPVPDRFRRKNFRVLIRTLKRKNIPEEWLQSWFER